MAELLNKLIPNVVERSDQLLKAFIETMQMVGAAGSVSLILGLAVGVLLFATNKNGVMENRAAHFVIGKLCDIFRAIPFIILATVLFDLSRFIVGTAIGVKGAVIPLLFGTIPYFARQVEAALAEVPPGLVEAAQSMGCSPADIIFRVYLKEAVPGITRGVTITLVSLVNFTAIAGALGAGGLGNFAIMYGHSKNLPDVKWTVVFIIILLISAIQAIGNYIAKRKTH